MANKPWERRLKDLALILTNCSKTYFEPELFRMNLNQFLQTSRTVTFIIQKNKESIPDFDAWYAQNVVEGLKSDSLMTWAKDSRNKIEKQGDLEMYSSASAKLAFSYLESEDIEFISCDAMLSTSIKKLTRFALKKMPTSLTDAAYIQVERRWVANTLPDWELLHALTTIYARMYESCSKLAVYLGGKIGEEIPLPSVLDCNRSSDRSVSYIKLRDFSQISVDYSISKNEDASIPDSIKAVGQHLRGSQINNIQQAVEFNSKIAEATFNESGYHISMLHFLDDKYMPIDMISYSPSDQADKYIFWRMAAERAKVLGAKAMISISEAWLRDYKDHLSKPISQMPIIGEKLNVYGANIHNEHYSISWVIERPTPRSLPVLQAATVDTESSRDVYFILPVIKAMQSVA
ncbi:hypothetical protein BCT47_16515 [Vibrio splendidus]|uniref:hypothetical protein n=1 Tax=Vibrio TaxID=662 RepID=UPI0006367870|nr:MULTISPECIES: hypothetical protein [Vibrio]PMM76429.1 hypothetical protein BCT47_16515 [Vibrio splendidus]PMN42689.1 hypothetical protein BCT36_20045 [Vibrio splendidus]CDT28157.1 Protein ea47 [Vibrio crassostreae]